MGNTVNFDTRNLTGFDTADLTEGTNLYFTNARADARIAAATTDDLSEDHHYILLMLELMLE